MPITITIPDRYIYVLLSAVGTGWLTTWQAILVGQHRKRAQIPYPQAYAEKAEAENNLDAKKFNCAQRAHQNTLENLPQTLLYLAVGGLEYPTWTAGLGTAWLLGRVVYTLGYITGDPIKRRRGGIGEIAGLALFLTATYSAGKLFYATL